MGISMEWRGCMAWGPALALVVGCGGSPLERVGSGSSAIVGGEEDPGDPAVVAIYAASSAGSALCTGEVIAPRVVLTAAHCIPDRLGGERAHNRGCGLRR